MLSQVGVSWRSYRVLAKMWRFKANSTNDIKVILFLRSLSVLTVPELKPCTLILSMIIDYHTTPG